MRIAVFIPVYSTPKDLASICEQLAADPYPDKEIVVVVDGQRTPAIAAELLRISALRRVRVVEGRGHLGKAAALNRAAAETEADALLFLDNDVRLPSIAGFLGRLASALDDRDLVELPKIGIGRGPLAAMMKVEFLVSMYSADGMARRLKACPSMNGAAFAIRKPLFDSLGGFSGVVNEDMDLAARAFLKGATFGFPAEISVGNAVSEWPSDWLRQRKRWMVNNAEWSRLYIGQSLRSSPEAARALCAIALRRTTPWLALVAGAGIAALVAGAFDFYPHWILASAALGAGAAWAVSTIAYERCARRFGAEFRLGSFLAYTLLYKPLITLVELFVGISIASGSRPKTDWTCSECPSGGIGRSIKPSRRSSALGPAAARARRRAALRRGNP